MGFKAGGLAKPKAGAGTGSKPGKGGAASKKMDPREAARQQQLEHESEIRRGMRVACDQLSKCLAAIVAACEASPDYAKECVDQMGYFAVPLLVSPLV